MEYNEKDLEKVLGGINLNELSEEELKKLKDSLKDESELSEEELSEVKAGMPLPYDAAKEEFNKNFSK